MSHDWEEVDEPPLDCSKNEDDLSSIHDFFTNDDGSSILDSIDPLNPRLSSASAQSSVTVISRGILKLSLFDLCGFIGEHKSLRRAQIVRVSTYSTRVNMVIVHRYLVLQLRREGTKKDIWVRVERLSRGGMSGIFRGAGRTPSNDTASLAANPELLTSLSKQESELVFRSSPSLDDFRRFLLVICEELIWYTPWPENCWMFCSLLQEHLVEIGDGWFQYGQLQHLRLAPDVRERVRTRIMAEGTPVTDPIPKLQSLLSLKEQSKSYDPYAIYLGISQSDSATSSHLALADSTTLVSSSAAFPPSLEDTSPISSGDTEHPTLSDDILSSETFSAPPATAKNSPSPSFTVPYEEPDTTPASEASLPSNSDQYPTRQTSLEELGDETGDANSEVTAEPEAVALRCELLRETCEMAWNATTSLQALLPALDVNFIFLQNEDIIGEADLYHVGELQRCLVTLHTDLTWVSEHAVDLVQSDEEHSLLALMWSTIQSAEVVLELRQLQLAGWAAVQKREDDTKRVKEVEGINHAAGACRPSSLDFQQEPTVASVGDTSLERPSTNKRQALELPPFSPMLSAKTQSATSEADSDHFPAKLVQPITIL